MADLFAQGQSQNAGRHHRSKRPFGCLWWTSWFPVFSAPRQYGWKYSRSAIEPATKSCHSLRARARARARARDRDRDRDREIVALMQG